MTPDLLVLIPARNERLVIGRVLEDLAAQEPSGLSVAGGIPDPSGGMPGVVSCLVVIDDGSTDGTGDVAREAIGGGGLAECAIVVRRDEAPTSKGDALQAGLTAALEHWRFRPDAMVLVLDADARIPASFLTDLLEAANGGPATSRRRMLQPRPAPAARDGIWRRWLACVQDDEQTVDLAIRRTRAAMGGVGELRGDAMVVPLRYLEAIGGFPRGATCEDLELSAALELELGQRVQALDRPSVWEQPVLEVGGLFLQRLRWAEGAIRRDLRWVLPRLGDRRIPLPWRLDAAAYGSQTALGLVICASWVYDVLRGRRPRFAIRLASAAAVAAFIGSTVALARFGESTAPPRGGLPVAGSGSPRRLRGPELVTRAASVVAFGVLWPVVTSIAWVRIAFRALSGRGPTRYEPTRKSTGFSAPWEP